MLAHTKGNDNTWTVIVYGNPYVFNSSHRRYSKLIDAVQTGNTDLFLYNLSLSRTVEEWYSDECPAFSISAGVLRFGTEVVATEITERVLEMIDGGYSPTPLMKFLTKLYNNSSRRAVMESYRWVTKHGIAIDNDGMLVGYKGVIRYCGIDSTDKNGRTLSSQDLVDKYTGNSYRNNPGDVPHMPRRQVCDDHTHGCSSGLHVGTYEYAVDWAGPSGCVMLVKFDPVDIVSVPSDCNYQKMRVCKYEVVSLTRGPIESLVYDHPDDDHDHDHDDIDWTEA